MPTPTSAPKAVIEAIPQEKPKELRLLVLLEKAKAFEYRVPVD